MHEQDFEDAVRKYMKVERTEMSIADKRYGPVTFSKRLGYTRQRIHQIENTDTKLTVEIVAKYAKEFDMSPVELFNNAVTPPQRRKPIDDRYDRLSPRDQAFLLRVLDHLEGK